MSHLRTSRLTTTNWLPTWEQSLIYLKTTPGLLKLTHLVLGIVAVTLVANQFDCCKQSTPQLFFLLVAVTFMIGTFCLLLSSLVPLKIDGIISKTSYEFIYQSVACVLSAIASGKMLYDLYHQEYRLMSYYYLLGSGIIGCILAVFYFIGASLAWCDRGS